MNLLKDVNLGDKMKVIFLDIDGVLNTVETYERVSCEFEETGVKKIEIDEFRVEYLRRIVEDTGAKIVLSSSLRGYFKRVGDCLVPKYEYYAPEFLQIFEKYGLSLYDVTPVLSGIYGSRQEEVKEWLLEHEEVDGFVILDDETTFLMEFVGTNLIQLNKLPAGVMVRRMEDCIGLGEEHIEQAIEILNKKNDVKKLVRKNFEK